ncbi:hypothetical protein [Streptomyces cyanogenus]|uniref:hypothetical protein n=1 Tax=Streptomyces cyanogenus TaxID=80860 RepID=UPI001AA1820D
MEHARQAALAGPAVDRPAGGPLGRHVVEGADELAGGGEPGERRHRRGGRHDTDLTPTGELMPM